MFIKFGLSIYKKKKKKKKILTSKHIDIDQHFIKEKLEDGVSCMSYVPPKEQVADIFTKELAKPVFESCTSKLGLLDIHKLA